MTVKRLLNIKEDKGYIRYYNDGYRYFSYRIASKSTGKKIRRNVLLTPEGVWYSHTGNGEPECSMSDWAIKELDDVVFGNKIEKGY